VSQIPPHGPERRLLPRWAAPRAAEAAPEPVVVLSSREAADLALLGMGAYTPLTGFMDHDTYRGVLREMQAAPGVLWPIPITLAVHPVLADQLSPGTTARLALPSGRVLGRIRVQDRFRPNLLEECSAVYGTCDPSHPGVAATLRQPPVYIGGPVEVWDLGPVYDRYRHLCWWPAEARAVFETYGWETVAAFQTRNPMHRSHEFLAKCALMLTDGLFIHQVLGELKSDDLPADVRVRAVDALVRHYFPENRVVQAGYPIAMRYAGPREAVLHAIIRQNYGATHLIVGRDHAGVGRFYGPYDAQAIFRQLPKGSLAIQPLCFDEAFYCRRCDGMTVARTCPHDPAERDHISGTELRRRLRDGLPISPHISRPEVVAVLRAALGEPVTPPPAV